jgi:hypothetical protein
MGRRAVVILLSSSRFLLVICPDDAGFPNWLEAAFPAI